jgi:hypothetical protein
MTQVSFTTVWDRTSYPPGEDPLAYCLAKLRLGTEESVSSTSAADDGPGVDLALVLDVSGSMDKPNRYPLLCDAVRRLVIGLRPQDRISVTLFTDRSETVIPFVPAEDAASDPDQIIQAMNDSGLLFGPRTNLAPGLRLALEGFQARMDSEGRARRTYVLTDGELHDMSECENALAGFRPVSTEVHVYGFGDEFNAVALKLLVSDQIGGTVKPIVNEEDITRTFAHVAAVNRRLIGTNAKLEVAFSPEVACGDAWLFQPQGRYLGAIRDRRLEYVIGGIESGRWYSLLLELRLPPAAGAVGFAEVSWSAGEERVSRRTEIIPVRKEGESAIVPEVRRALDILQTLRTANDSAAKLASYKARRELAVLENRDPELIAALDKLIAGMTSPPAGATTQAAEPVKPEPGLRLGMRVDRSALDEWTALLQRRTAEARLTEREQLILDSDPSTAIPDFRPRTEFPAVRLMYDLMDVLAESVASGSLRNRVIERAVHASRKYVSKKSDVNPAMALLVEFSEVVGVPAEFVIQLAERIFESSG